MLLAEWFPVFVARQLDLEDTTIATYAVAIRKFSKWKMNRDGSPLDTQDLCIDLVTDWLAHLVETEKLMPRSINSYRSSINAVWCAAMRGKLSPREDSRLVPSCRIPRKIPVAWSLNDMKRLLVAAQEKTGRRRNEWNTLRRDFWLGLYLFLYDTGARFGAALELAVGDVDLQRRCVLLRAETAKTKTDHLVSISSETATVLRRLIADGYPLVWPNGINRQQLYEEHKRTLAKLDLPFDRYHMFHCFRKTTATQLAISSSIEVASKALGHASVALTKRTYVDARQLPLVRASSMLPRPFDDPDDDGERAVLKFARSG